jgi:hypothetical protein
VAEEDQFVQAILRDPGVLARARAISLARLLCRSDIVRHLQLHGSNVRTGRLPVHMESVAVAAESAMRLDVLLMPSSGRERIHRANQRHHETGVSLDQRRFVWATFVDAYAFAAELSGHPKLMLDESKSSQLVAGAMSFARAFGLPTTQQSLAEVRAHAEWELAQIPPSGVVRGLWLSVMQVVRSPEIQQFLRPGAVREADVLVAIEQGLPLPLFRALRGR